LIVGIIVTGLVIFKPFKTSSASGDSASTSGSPIERSKAADFVIGYNTFPGMEGILYMNNGMEPNENSELFRKYGIKLQIKQIDVVSDSRDGLKTGALDAVYCTTDALPVEMSSGSSLLDLKVKQIMKVNESRGADALVTNSTIATVSQLKGKKVAYAIGTASNTLLINLLETNNMSIDDIQTYKVADGVEAANAFKNKQCDAALVWAPDDEDCVAAVKGSKILVTTKTATQIISDGLLVTDKNLQAKKTGLVKLVKAWLEGNATIATNADAMKTANKLFAAGFNFPEDVAAISSSKIRFSTLGDNKMFFGLDATYSGVTGEKMYGRMAIKYSEISLAKSPAPWRNVSTSEVIEAILEDQAFATTPAQAAEGAVVFAAATPDEIKREAAGSKVVTLTFENNSFKLDDNAKATIEREISQLAQAFANSKIRVEGNTDNVGNYGYNVELSKSRANAVVEYLVREYKFDKNKFIVVGNGPSKPVDGCKDVNNDACNQRNRRTEFKFIWNE
jgi:NitT/TauT family transport system substrate-binding protein